MQSKLSCFVVQRLGCWCPECSSVGGTVAQNTSKPQTYFQGFICISVLICGTFNRLDFTKMWIHNAVPKNGGVLPWQWQIILRYLGAFPPYSRRLLFQMQPCIFLQIERQLVHAQQVQCDWLLFTPWTLHFDPCVPSFGENVYVVKLRCYYLGSGFAGRRVIPHWLLPWTIIMCTYCLCRSDFFAPWNWSHLCYPHELRGQDERWDIPLHAGQTWARAVLKSPFPQQPVLCSTDNPSLSAGTDPAQVCVQKAFLSILKSPRGDR